MAQIVGNKVTKMSLIIKIVSLRDQYVQLGNIKSECHAISCGILQGSVMGPLLFNIVINDLKSATSKFDLVMYADDTTLVSTLENFGDRNNAKEIEQNMKKTRQSNNSLFIRKMINDS